MPEGVSRGVRCGWGEAREGAGKARGWLVGSPDAVCVRETQTDGSVAQGAGTSDAEAFDVVSLVWQSRIGGKLMIKTLCLPHPALLSVVCYTCLPRPHPPAITMYAPHSERDRYLKGHGLDVECDDTVQLIQTHTLPPQAFPRPSPAPLPAPAPAPVQPARPLHYIVSDPLDRTMRQLTHLEFENLDAAALGSLNIEDIVPNRSFPGTNLKFAVAPSRANAHRRPDSRYVPHAFLVPTC